jgi:hypothetical protein
VLSAGGGVIVATALLVLSVGDVRNLTRYARTNASPADTKAPGAPT